MTDTATKTVNDYLHELRAATVSLAEYKSRIAEETKDARALITSVEEEFAPITEALDEAIGNARAAIRDLMTDTKVEKVRDADYLAYFTPRKKRELVDVTAAKEYLDGLGVTEEYTTINESKYIKDHPDGPGVRTTVNNTLNIRDDAE